jgi:hypothetical protein
MSQQVTTHIDLQLQNRERMSAFFRLIFIIPIAIYSSSFFDYSSFSGDQKTGAFAGVFILPVVLTLLVRGVYPSYVLAFNKAMMNLSLRISAYLFLLNDQYPSIESNEKTYLEFPEIDGGKTLSRGMPLVKWLLAIPLYIVGAVYILYSVMLTLVAWITIVFTGEYPEWCAAGVVGTMSYWNRVFGYAFALVTDEYPSFSL